MPAINMPVISFKVNILQAKSCTRPFNRICDRTITRILGENGIPVSPDELYIYLNSIIVIPNDIYFVYIIYIYFVYQFCAIPSIKYQD